VESLEPLVLSTADVSRKAICRVFLRGDGVFECIGLLMENVRGGPLPAAEGESGGGLRVMIVTPENSPGPMRPTSVVTIFTAFCSDWTAQTRSALLDIVR